MDARNAESGSPEKPSRRPSAPPSGGQPVEALAMQLARLSETVARQAEAIRILADRVATLEGKEDESADTQPTHYLSGKPIFR